jgi:hypothetical protein
MSGVPEHFRFIERHDIGGIEARTQRMTAQIGFGRRRACRQLRVLCAVVRPQLILRQQAQPVGPQALRQQSARMTLEEHRDRVGRRLIEIQAKTVVLDVGRQHMRFEIGRIPLEGLPVACAERIARRQEGASLPACAAVTTSTTALMTRVRKCKLHGHLLSFSSLILMIPPAHECSR